LTPCSPQPKPGEIGLELADEPSGEQSGSLIRLRPGVGGILLLVGIAPLD
jgi:hypothetical protein